MVNIFGTDEDIQNRMNMQFSTFSRVWGKSLVNIGPIITEISMWNHTHRNRLFRETIFRPVEGAEPLTFYTH